VEGNRQGIRERESGLQWREIGRESERGRQTHDRDSGQFVAYRGGDRQGIRERETGICQIFRTLRSLQ
jgi:hypothetical protein